MLTGNLHGDMAEPAILFRTVPVLDIGGNHYDAALMQADSGLAFFLIPAFTSRADQELTAAFVCMMNMPVIAALNWTTSPQSLVVAGFNSIHFCALCKSFLTSSFCQVIFLFLPRSKPLLQG